ncbi:c-type cytochrome [Pelomonas sp. V22]|uniref:c-type cytochrome n=1 Tax=Pelomonas sp. V22 TaxID=2822139 RepID=UPI0024A91254|nr:c-type cytochrome [Pelomonas sp. V22]MDI4631958.1 c-type cytochrome [Pelomonas sp. V22]
MCNWADLRRLGALLLLGLFAGLAAAQAKVYEGIGRPATPKEIAAWDIDVRPDFKGLPKGSGTVARGQAVWEGKCAQCHGTFGESSEVFNPLVGGTTAEDVKTGHVARLNDKAYPSRTTLMKVATVSTLWDYINRAMPWNAPKSLKPDEVYAVTAYLLNLGDVLPADYELSDRNIAEVQARMPNRLGMSLDHKLWPGSMAKAKGPDTHNSACMKDCPVETRLASSLPEHARNAHGNLAEQNRGVGAQRGADTSRPAGSPVLPAPPKPAAAAQAAMPTALLNKHSCSGCHGLESRVVGPSFREVAKRYAGRADAESYLAGKIRSGGTGVWGSMQMPAQSLGEADAVMIARWLAAGAPR